MKTRKWIIYSLCTVGGAYLAVCALLYFKQRSLIYFPDATHVVATRPDFAVVDGDATLRGWVTNPGQAQAIVYFGGNAEEVGANRQDFATWFPSHSVYLVAYRGYGASAGKPSESAIFRDALRVYDRVAQLHPGRQPAVIGRSLGSGVASYVASRRPVSKLALITPFSSLADVAQSHYRIFPIRMLLKDRYESADYLQKYSRPLLILRAGRDQVVPPSNTMQLIAALPMQPQVIDFPEAGHDDIGLQPGYSEALRDFFD